MKEILIFIRSFNDFDQALPIIDYINTKTDNKVFVWTFEKKLQGCQHHIKYLTDNLGIKVESLYEKLSKLSKINHRSYSFILKISSKSNRYPVLLPVTILISKIRVIFDYFFRIGYSELLREFAFDIIMIDTGMDSTIHGQNILLAAKKQGIRSIGYAHGYSIYSNFNSVQKGRVSHGRVKSFILKLAKPKIKRLVYADYYLTAKGQISAQFKKTHASGHYDASELYKVKEIGMPRYTIDWNKKYKEKVLDNQIFSYGDSNKLNIVLFMSHPQYNVRMDVLYGLIDELSTMDAINFVYKPHTRRGLHLINKNQLNGIDVSDVSSVLLSEWADLGIVYGSSIATQLLVDEKPLVIPSFVHLNRTIYEDNGVAISVNTADKLINLMCKPKSEIMNMVDKNKVDAFIDSTVYGCDKDNMMDNYCSFANCC